MVLRGVSVGYGSVEVVGKCGIRFPDLGNNPVHGVSETIPDVLAFVVRLLKLAARTPTASLILATTITMSSSSC